MHDRVVFFLIDTLNTGGAERSLLDIVSRFKRYKPVVCHVYKGDMLKEEFVAKGIQTISLDIPGPYNLKAAESAVKDVIKKTDPVLIHSSLFKSDIIARRVASALGIPLINSLVNNTYHASRFTGAGVVMKFKLKVIQWYDAWTSRKADLFISNSATIKKSNSKALGIPLDKIKVIYRGRDVNDFTFEPVRAESLRQSFGISKSEKIMLNVSRLIHRKGQLELIRAFRTIAAQRPDVVLFIAGEGGYRNTLQTEIELLHLEKRVQILGNRKDIPLLMQMADYFVFPSHYEGLPGVLIEAMLSKLPIVASDIPENLECVDAAMAHLFPSGDVARLAAVLQHVLDNEKECMVRAEKAYTSACEKFAISTVADLYEATYDDLLKSMNGPR